MMKEKRKGEQKNSWMKFSLKLAVFLLIPIILCGIVFVAVGIFGVGAGGNFRHFETPEQVAEFLYENLEVAVSTPDDVLQFVSQYDAKSSCGYKTPYQLPDSHIIIDCNTVIRSGILAGGIWAYWIEFQFYNNTLDNIEVRKICSCL